MHSRNINIDSEWSSMCHWTLGLTKINSFNLRSPIWTVVCKSFPFIRTVTFLNTSSNEWTENFSLQGDIWLEWEPKKGWHFYYFNIVQKKLFSRFFLRIFKTSTNILWCGRFLSDKSLKMWNHMSDLIKYGVNLFKIWSLAALPSA